MITITSIYSNTYYQKYRIVRIVLCALIKSNPFICHIGWYLMLQENTNFYSRYVYNKNCIQLNTRYSNVETLALANETHINKTIHFFPGNPFRIIVFENEWCIQFENDKRSNTLPEPP